MTKLAATLLGVFLTISVLVGATVVAQTFSDPTRVRTARVIQQTQYHGLAPATGSVLEYEIRIWKDGAPITPTLKLRAHPGETSQLKIPEGTVDLAFRPEGTGIEAGAAFATPSRAAQQTGKRAGAAPGSTPAYKDPQANDANVLQQLRAIEQLARAHGPADKTTNAEARDRLLSEVAKADDLTATEQALLSLRLSRAAAENKDYEKRLADIEKKLERILNVIDQAAAASKAANHGPDKK